MRIPADSSLQSTHKNHLLEKKKKSPLYAHVSLVRKIATNSPHAHPHPHRMNLERHRLLQLARLHRPMCACERENMLVYWRSRKPGFQAPQREKNTATHTDTCRTLYNSSSSSSSASHCTYAYHSTHIGRPAGRPSPESAVRHLHTVTSRPYSYVASSSSSSSSPFLPFLLSLSLSLSLSSSTEGGLFKFDR